MNKMLFKNHVVNIIVGALLLVLAITAYFLGWYSDFVSIMIGVILAILSVKRFSYSYKKVVSKYSTTILIVELLLDIVLIGLLMYYQNYVAIYVGAIIYLRGVSYLIINYITTRKILLGQYLLNIFYVTLGSFFMFTGIDLVAIFEYFVLAIFGVLGLYYLIVGIKSLPKKEKKVKEVPLSPQRDQELHPQLNQKSNVNETTPKESSKTINYQTKTVSELRKMAKDQGLNNISSLRKSDLIELLEKHK